MPFGSTGPAGQSRSAATCSGSDFMANTLWSVLFLVMSLIRGGAAAASAASAIFIAVDIPQFPNVTIEYSARSYNTSRGTVNLYASPRHGEDGTRSSLINLSNTALLNLNGHQAISEVLQLLAAKPKPPRIFKVNADDKGARFARFNREYDPGVNIMVAAEGGPHLLRDDYVYLVGGGRGAAAPHYSDATPLPYQQKRWEREELYTFYTKKWIKASPDEQDAWLKAEGGVPAGFAAQLHRQHLDLRDQLHKVVKSNGGYKAGRTRSDNAKKKAVMDARGARGSAAAAAAPPALTATGADSCTRKAGLLAQEVTLFIDGEEEMGKELMQVFVNHHLIRGYLHGNSEHTLNQAIVDNIVRKIEQLPTTTGKKQGTGQTEHLRLVKKVLTSFLTGDDDFYPSQRALSRRLGVSR